MESDESYFGFGVSSREETFYPLLKYKQTLDYSVPDSLGGFSIGMSLDVVNNSRSIYNALDFLGDVGGLFSILVDFGKILISIPVFILGTGANKFLTENLFKQSEDHSKTTLDDKPLEAISARQPVHLNASSSIWGCRNSRYKRLTNAADDCISKELDIVTFLKKQMMQSIALSTLFTKTERFLIKNQRKFVLPQTSSCDESDYDCDRMYEEAISSTYYGELLNGTQPSSKK